jgi:hypothetical protein
VGIVGDYGCERVVAAEGQGWLGVGNNYALLVDSGLDVDYGVGRRGIDGGLHGLVLGLGANGQFPAGCAERTNEY